MHRYPSILSLPGLGASFSESRGCAPELTESRPVEPANFERGRQLHNPLSGVARIRSRARFEGRPQLPSVIAGGAGECEKVNLQTQLAEVTDIRFAIASPTRSYHPKHPYLERTDHVHY